MKRKVISIKPSRVHSSRELDSKVLCKHTQSSITWAERAWRWHLHRNSLMGTPRDLWMKLLMMHVGLVINHHIFTHTRPRATGSTSFFVVVIVVWDCFLTFASIRAVLCHASFRAISRQFANNLVRKLLERFNRIIRPGSLFLGLHVPTMAFASFLQFSTRIVFSWPLLHLKYLFCGKFGTKFHFLPKSVWTFSDTFICRVSIFFSDNFFSKIA